MYSHNYTMSIRKSDKNLSVLYKPITQEIINQTTEFTDMLIS